MPKEFLVTDIKIDGLKELARFIDQLPKKSLKKALKSAVSAGSTPIKRTAKTLVPKLTGTLKKAIARKVKTYPNGNAIAIIGADRGVTGMAHGASRARSTGLHIPANYVHLVELGVAPHPQPKNPWFKKDGHSGFKGKHFLERAMKQNEGKTKKIMEDKMQEVLLKEAAKLASK